MSEPDRIKRNPTITAFLIVLVVGGAYAAVGSTVMGGWMAVDQFLRALTHKAPASGNYFQLLRDAMLRFQVPILVMTTIFQFAFLLLLAKHLAKKWIKHPIVRYVRFVPPKPIPFLLGTGGLFLAIPAILWLGELAQHLFPVLSQFQDTTDSLVTVRDPAHALLVVFSICLTPAICEEFLFRGLFHRTLEERWRQPGIWLLSGTVFALFHQNYFGLVPLIFVGTWLGFIFQRSRSIFTSAFAHAGYNGILVLLSNQKDIAALMVGSNGFIRPWLAATSGALALFIAALLLRQTTRITSTL